MNSLSSGSILATVELFGRPTGPAFHRIGSLKFYIRTLNRKLFTALSYSAAMDWCSLNAAAILEESVPQRFHNVNKTLSGQNILEI